LSGGAFRREGSSDLCCEYQFVVYAVKDARILSHEFTDVWLKAQLLKAAQHATTGRMA